MSGGRYWNEDTQRWEDGAPVSPPAAQPTAPPPARPDFAPDPAAKGAGTADGQGTAGGAGAPAGAAGAAGSAGATGGGEAQASGWPGGGAANGWHGPGAGGTVVDGGRSVPAAPAAGAGTWPAYGPGTGGAGRPYGESGAGAGAGTGGAGWPPPVELSSDAPAGRSSRRLVWSVVVGAAAVGVVVSLVLTLVVGKNGDDPDHGRAAASTSAGPTPSGLTSSGPPASTASASPSATAPPAGYQSYDDEEGFRVAVPEGWTRSTVPSQYGIAVVNYRSPDREHRLQVYQVQESSPAASFQLYLSDETPKPAGFEKLDLKTLDDGEFRGSRLEYLADRIKGEPDVGTWHVVDERFFAPDGNIYAIASYGPESDGGAGELKLLTAALDWFCPPYTTCDADPALD